MTKHLLSLFLVALVVAASCSDAAETTSNTSDGGGGGTMTTGGQGGTAGEDGGGGQGGDALACPAAIDFEYISAASRVDNGYTGFGHGQRRDNGIGYRLELYDCDDECRRCRVRGPIEREGAFGSRKRCFNDLRQECDSDAECVAHGGPPEIQLCRFSNTLVDFRQAAMPTCLFTIFDPGDSGYAIEGTFDLATGDTAFTKFDSIIGASIGSFCQGCNGDTTPNDGNKDGTCSRLGNACDVNLQSGGAQFEFSTSFDCMIDDPASPGDLNYTDVVLPNRRLGVTSTDRQLVLSAASPDCGAPGFTDQKCYCGVCEGTTTACANADVCEPGVPCTAGTFETRPDGCMDACAFNAAEGVHTCLNEMGQTIGCFPSTEPVPTPGSNQNMGDFYSIVLGSASCFPPSGTATDPLLGLPGLLRNAEPVRATIVAD